MKPKAFAKLQNSSSTSLNYFRSYGNWIRRNSVIYENSITKPRWHKVFNKSHFNWLTSGNLSTWWSFACHRFEFQKTSIGKFLWETYVWCKFFGFEKRLMNICKFFRPLLLWVFFQTQPRLLSASQKHFSLWTYSIVNRRLWISLWRRIRWFAWASIEVPSLRLALEESFL